MGTLTNRRRGGGGDAHLVAVLLCTPHKEDTARYPKRLEHVQLVVRHVLRQRLLVAAHTTTRHQRCGACGRLRGEIV